VLEITPHILIPLRELSVTFSRSSKPGGQNVNKVNTRVTLIFDVVHSPSLSAALKTRIRQRLAGRINKLGLLRVVSYRYRTQAANRVAALERFASLLREALHETKTRKKTRQPRSAKEGRLAAKKHRSLIKQMRGAGTKKGGHWQD
jgi:ribosome-associated protein